MSGHLTPYRCRQLFRIPFRLQHCPRVRRRPASLAHRYAILETTRAFANSAASLGKKNHYQIIGVKENATFEELKKERSKRVLNGLHPDSPQHKPGPEARKKWDEFSISYDILIDPVQRKRYDDELAKVRGKELPKDGGQEWSAHLEVNKKEAEAKEEIKKQADAKEEAEALFRKLREEKLRGEKAEAVKRAVMMKKAKVADMQQQQQQKRKDIQMNPEKVNNQANVNWFTSAFPHERPQPRRKAPGAPGNITPIYSTKTRPPYQRVRPLDATSPHVARATPAENLAGARNRPQVTDTKIPLKAKTPLEMRAKAQGENILQNNGIGEVPNQELSIPEKLMEGLHLWVQQRLEDIKEVEKSLQGEDREDARGKNLKLKKKMEVEKEARQEGVGKLPEQTQDVVAAFFTTSRFAPLLAIFTSPLLSGGIFITCLSYAVWCYFIEIYT